MPTVELIRDLPKMQMACEFGVPKCISSKVIVLTNMEDADAEEVA